MRFYNDGHPGQSGHTSTTVNFFIFLFSLVFDIDFMHKIDLKY